MLDKAPERLPSDAIAQWLWPFEKQGKTLDTPLAILSVETLVDMLEEARTKPSIIDVLAERRTADSQVTNA
ncbi:hypothetical protein [Chelativorans sp. YIM 93263]|uniref:hypothetical protein n=1 Tax=Chelativorans sp. YIM 93263 TaxID=2906648 RepID=UPI002378DAF7|nr:hypothetical protein [Chelativorans sp. YIM 93263]